ncbi:MAG: nucleotidyltransferase domain-containing protein [Bacteroidales bacterium]
MKSFGAHIRNQRTSRGLTLRRVAADIETDVAILSKVERGIRQASRNLVIKLAEYYSLDEASLLKMWMQNKWSRELTESNALVNEPVSVYVQSAMPTFAEIKQKVSAILRKDKRILKAFLFGSFSRNEATDFSDIDILIKTDNRFLFTLFDLAEIAHKTEKVLGRKTDVVTERALSPEILESIHENLKVLYEKK